jgi:hypothetical protein
LDDNLAQNTQIVGDRLVDLQGRLADGIIDITDRHEEEKRD